MIAPHDFLIKASENFVTPGFALDLVAVREFVDYRRECVDVVWSVSPEHAGITLVNGRLKVAKNVHDIEQITVSCTELATGLHATRYFPIAESARHGALVHFIKSDHIYAGENFYWDLWTYGEAQEATAVTFGERTDFGVCALSQNKHVIARKKTWGLDWCNDWSEQSISFELDKVQDNYYIIDGETSIYTSLYDVICRTNPRIEYAVMDDPETIIVYLSHPPIIGTNFELYINSIRQHDIGVLHKNEKKQIVLIHLPHTVKPNDLLEIRANHTFLPHKVTMRKFLDNFYYSGDDMGVVFSHSNISLRLWAPTARMVELLTYAQWQNEVDQPDHCFALHFDVTSGTHYVQVNRLEFEYKFYLYRLYFDDIDIRGNQYTRITYAVDPYAHAIGLNGERGVLLDLNSPELTPSNWHSDKRPSLMAKEDSIIYEMHLRDFTIAPQSGVSEELRGKFLGASQVGLSYTDTASGERVSTGIDSLVELGITHAHILPFFDFSSVDETKLDEKDNRNWGYDPKNYNAPDGSYSLDPYAPSLRIKEARRMIQGFHQNGIRVVMDMVYNHMTDTSNLDNIVPGYYFRSDSYGKFTNGSGCGNELATEHPMVGKFIIDSILHWINDYKIDGIRLDLMELMDINTMHKIVDKVHAIDSSLLVYGEPWKGGDSPLIHGTYRGSQRGHNFSIFNDVFRDAIRGTNHPSCGFVNGEQHVSERALHVIDGLKGSIHNLTDRAFESINYADAHDNYTLWDHIEKSQSPELAMGSYRQDLADNLLDNILVRQNLLALGIIFTALGIPFIQGGVEILRTKNGDHNSYKSGDEVNAIHWQDKITYKPIFEYVQGCT